MITLPIVDLRLLLSALSGLVLIGLLIALWSWYRRRRARAALLAAVTASAVEFQRDVLVPDGQGGWVHVDFLLLTARGCVVIDMRDVPGMIFGGDQMTDWTVMHRAQRTTFTNPQTGLYDRIAVVRALVGDMPVEGRVVFSARGQFPKGLPRYTLMLSSIEAEFPKAVPQMTEQAVGAWREDWQRLVAACRPSSLVDPKRAI